MMLSIFLCSESLPAALRRNGSYNLSSAPATTSTQVGGIGEACRYAADLPEELYDDPLANVRSVGPFAALRHCAHLPFQSRRRGKKR